MQDCGTIYTAPSAPRSPWICDVCGGDVVQRADDTEEAINRRLDLYESQTVAADRRTTTSHGLLEVRRRRSASPDDVIARLVNAVDARRAGERRPVR